jgi:hypothetical protein
MSSKTKSIFSDSPFKSRFGVVGRWAMTDLDLDLDLDMDLDPDPDPDPGEDLKAHVLVAAREGRSSGGPPPTPGPVPGAPRLTAQRPRRS